MAVGWGGEKHDDVTQGSDLAHAMLPEWEPLLASLFRSVSDPTSSKDHSLPSLPSPFLNSDMSLCLGSHTLAVSQAIKQEN